MEIETLLSLDPNLRNSQWEQDLIKVLPKINFRLLDEQPQFGPDGFPYMFVEVGSADHTEPFVNLLEWVAGRGIGIAVNPQKTMPDYVFSYGMIWYWVLNGYLNFDSPNSVPGQIVFENGTGLHSGDPSDEYLPKFVRQILREFLQQNQVDNPKILVLSSDQNHYDLCFSLDSFGHPPQQEHKDILEALGWFLPNHYSLMLLNEDGLPKFFDL